jgi:hypothetical protein
MILNFVGREVVQSAQGLRWIMFLGSEESCVMGDAHLFILQILASSFETSWQGEMAWCREAFHGLGVQDVAEIDSD